MKVKKRSGNIANMKFDNVTQRISQLTKGLSSAISADKVSQQVFSSMYDGITTQEIDILTSEIAVGMMTEHPDYEILATRIAASNIQKRTPKIFTKAMKILYDNNILSSEVWEFISTNNEILDNSIQSGNDFEFGFFGLKTLEKNYLMKINKDTLIETPQYLLLRVSCGIHTGNTEKTIETYRYMSDGYFIHATPTLFNASTLKPQMSSCFLVAMKDDSIDGIYATLKECADISKWAGGIGLHAHNIRAKNSMIRGTNGTSGGLIPMLRVFNSTARYVNQSGKRKGSFAIYLEPWHADIQEFLELRLNQGDEESRTRDLFTALWIPDLFMKRVEKGENWSLFCPDTAPGLADVYGEEFETLYTQYENEGRANKVVPASDIWVAILKSQSETGTPYMLYKDACNEKSNQKNLGVIKSSNLCTEIIEYSNKDETAVCNLASIALPKLIENGKFNYEKLYEITKTITYNLNEVIDKNFYPVETARNSNMKHRPIGIGVQGLADAFNLCDLPFDCADAKSMNIAIFETIYHAALEASLELSKEFGPYESFKGSPASQGKLQFDLWSKPSFSGKYDWVKMKRQIKKFGLRNSLLVAPMPTASTSQILGNNECIEPYTTNIYLRRTLAGEFVVVNKHLVKELQALGLWSKEMKDHMIKESGSVQNIPNIPENIKEKYKTVWEISQKVLIDMARDRGCFIDQSQSLNLFMENPTVSKLSSMHMYAWKQGLKTGLYYLRSKAKAKATQFTICPSCSA